MYNGPKGGLISLVYKWHISFPLHSFPHFVLYVQTAIRKKIKPYKTTLKHREANQKHKLLCFIIIRITLIFDMHVQRGGFLFFF